MSKCKRSFGLAAMISRIVVYGERIENTIQHSLQKHKMGYIATTDAIYALSIIDLLMQLGTLFSIHAVLPWLNQC